MRTYRCPRCGELLRADELVEEDGEAGDVSLLASPPPKHLSVATAIDGFAPVTTLRYRRFSPVELFLVPFTCVWGGFSLAGIYGSQIMKHEFDLHLSLFGLPFLVGSVVLVAMCLFLLFGKRVLTLSSGKGAYFTGVGPVGWTKRFTYGRDTRVVEEFAVSHGRRGSSTTYFLRLKNGADDVTVCSGFSDAARVYAAAVIRRECGRV